MTSSRRRSCTSSARRALPIAAPVRAIRAALAASAAVLALSGSGIVLAGTCIATGTKQVTCNGAFASDVSNSIPPANLVVDLTLVVGTDGSTTVDPAAGSSGITSTWGGDAVVITYADISTTDADGVHMYSADGTAGFYNYGSITTHVASGSGDGASIGALHDVHATNGGSIVAEAVAGTAYDVAALYAYSRQGTVEIENQAGSALFGHGADGQGAGIYANGYFGASVTNHGDVGGTSINGRGLGIVANSQLAASIDNDGSVAAYSGSGASIGLDAVSIWSDAMVDNAGDVHAASAGDAVGALAKSTLGATGVFNSGTIEATSHDGRAFGASASTRGAARIVNSGDIEATSNETFGYGASALSIAGDASVVNVGTISVSAYHARGVRAQTSDGDAYVGNSGLVEADSVHGGAQGISATTSTGSATVINSGDVSATGSYRAGGISAFGLGDVHVGNSGTIYVGSLDSSMAVFGRSDAGDVTLVNQGDIVAVAPGSAIGVWLIASGQTNIYNTGTIQASGSDSNVAIRSSGITHIYNQGTITGAIQSGDDDDYLYNGADGVWNATIRYEFGYSNFWRGDDVIVNHGLIAMTDTTISLGDGANSFDNTGVVSAEGDNWIDMGQGANPFYNSGSIDFVDGAPDDTLAILGDFAGSGDIGVDASGLTGGSDILYIYGSVVGDSTGSINVELLDLPTSIETIIPIVYVSGDSTADSFELGTVNWDEADSFLALDFDLVPIIDASNAEADVFALGIGVSGLSDPGTIAASVAPGVHSLFASQIGTWRQRMGVIDSYPRGGVGFWARAFYNRGDFSPGHELDGFGSGGNFDYEFFNSGAEAGVDVALTDEFSIGLLVAKSRAKHKLGDPGIATAKVEADTWGIYGTWISPGGFYLDASYRWMDFGTTLESIAGLLEGDGDAVAFNVEAGYAFTLAGGLKIEPQLQYTDTEIRQIDAFETSGGMVFQPDPGHSSRGRLGVAFRRDFGDADTGWLFTPYATLSVVEEFDGDHGFRINDTYFGRTDTEGTSGMLELGFNARRSHLAVYGGVTWQDGGALNDFIGGHLGVRYTFGAVVPAPAPVAAVVPSCADRDDDGDGVNNCDDKCPGSTAGRAVGPDGCPVPMPEPEPAPEPKPFRG